jgi:peptide deformylase
MSVKPIVTDRGVLGAICDRAYYDDIEVIQDLKDTAATLHNCAGLAAPQVGHQKRIILVHVQGQRTIMVNPIVLDFKGKFSLGNEGCFSVPITMTVPRRVKRWFKVRIQYINEEGDLVQELFKSFEARLIQHEIDHLDGILI